jgi:SnoaL-like domain
MGQPGHESWAALAARVQVLEDVEAIRQLKAEYCRRLDGGWASKAGTHMGPVADLFTDDGVWDGTPHAPRAQGREQIRQMMIDFRAIPFVMHLVTNPLIEVSGDRASGQWSIIVPTNASSEPTLSVGTYDEEYVRTVEGWKFQSLRFIATGSAQQLTGWQLSDGP